MGANNKSTKEFISDVIMPIEQISPDKGKLFALIKASYFTKNEYAENPDPSYRSEEWSFPTEKKPGNWIDSNGIKVETISGILWSGLHGGRLYEVEYEGKKEKLGFDDYIIFHNYQKLELEAQKHIFSCIPLGYKVKKARLIQKVDIWRPYFLWTFTLDCIERVFNYLTISNPEIYIDAINYARAVAKYRCGIDTSEIEKILNIKISNLKFLLIQGEKEYEIRSKLEGDSAFGSYLYLKRAIIDSFESNKFLAAIINCRTAIAMRPLTEYKDRYEMPSIIDDDKEAELKRIWYALHKRELDWQVNHLNELIGL